jgi:hypothetical protein
MKWVGRMRLIVQTTPADRLRAWRKAPLFIEGDVALKQRFGREAVIREYLRTCISGINWSLKLSV